MVVEVSFSLLNSISRKQRKAKAFLHPPSQPDPYFPLFLTLLGFLCLSSSASTWVSLKSVTLFEYFSRKTKKLAIMGASNKITALLNFIALLCSIPIISAGVWLSSKEDNQCVHLFRWPVLLLGILILLVSLAGFVGSYWNREGLLACYLFSMALLIILLLILLVFAFVVTRPDGSYVVPGKGYKEYKLDGFSFWLRHYITKSGDWGKIRSCLAQSNMCSKLGQNYGSADQFFLAHISPLQSGCCKPPTVCGHGYVNPTLWINPVNPTADPDCFIWNNDQMQLCYDCNACKAGLLGNLRKEWRRANVILIITVVVLICVYLIACSAFKNAQTEELFRRYKEGWA